MPNPKTANSYTWKEVQPQMSPAWTLPSIPIPTKVGGCGFTRPTALSMHTHTRTCWFSPQVNLAREVHLYLCHQQILRYFIWDLASQELLEKLISTSAISKFFCVSFGIWPLRKCWPGTGSDHIPKSPNATSLPAPGFPLQTLSRAGRGKQTPGRQLPLTCTRRKVPCTLPPTFLWWATIPE